MRLLILALAVPAFAQPALAREHSRHHARVSAHSHHAHFHSGYRYTSRTARRVGVLSYGDEGFSAGERYGAFEDRQPEYRPSRPVRRFLAERSFESGYKRPYGSEFRERSASFARSREASHDALDGMIARHAQMNGLPESLVHRLVIRESRYNPRAVGRGGAMGLMQIKYSTARAMGYTGSPSGLLDPETNLTYAVRYLAGAYRAARGNAGGAVSNYARGYYGSAKRAGFSPYQGPGWSGGYASALPGERVVSNDSRRRARYWY